MTEHRDGIVYSKPGVFGGASPAVIATHHASLETLAALPAVALIDCKGPPDGRPVRLNLWLLGEGSEDQSVREDLYIVLPSGLTGGGVLCQKIGQLSGTLGAEVVPAFVPSGGGGVGEVPTLQWCKTISWVSTGFAEALSGGALAPRPFPDGSGAAGSPCGLAVHDIGPALGLLRVPAKGTGSPATAAAGVHQRWR